MTRKTEVTLAGVTIYVDYSYHSARRGARRDGLQIDPDEVEDIEIDQVTVDEGVDVSELLMLDNIHGRIRDIILDA